MAVVKAWQSLFPWYVRLAVNDKGRCFRSFQDLTTTYKWQPWQPYRLLDASSLPDELDGCNAITTHLNWRKWRPSDQGH